MKKMLILVSVLMVGCVSQPIVYSHTPNSDFLTKESRGNNLSDYADLRAKAEDMCRSEGYTQGIEVLDARPGVSTRPEGIGSYTLAYKCKDKGFVDKAITAYGEVKKQLGN